MNKLILEKAGSNEPAFFIIRFKNNSFPQYSYLKNNIAHLRFANQAILKVRTTLFLKRNYETHEQALIKNISSNNCGLEAEDLKERSSSSNSSRNLIRRGLVKPLQLRKALKITKGCWLKIKPSRLAVDIFNALNAG